MFVSGGRLIQHPYPFRSPKALVMRAAQYASPRGFVCTTQFCHGITAYESARLSRSVLGQ